MQIRHLIVKDFKILTAGKLNLVPPVDPISNGQTITHTLTLRPEANHKMKEQASSSLLVWLSCDRTVTILMYSFISAGKINTLFCHDY